MKNTITMTSKGTFTLPAKIRKSLGLKIQGEQLIINFDPKTQIIQISKPQDFEEIQEKTAKFIKKDKKPLLNVDEFYQSKRKR